jgi:hypothetical protein
MLSLVNKNLTAHMSANAGTSPSPIRWENSLDFWEFMNVVCDTKPNKQTLRHPKEEHEATAHRRKRKTRNHQLTTPSNSQPTTLSNQNIMLNSLASLITSTTVSNPSPCFTKHTSLTVCRFLQRHPGLCIFAQENDNDNEDSDDDDENPEYKRAKALSLKEEIKKEISWMGGSAAAQAPFSLGCHSSLPRRSAINK